MTKERPILFSGAMVRAILDGRKTQTRREVKPQPYIDEMGNFCWNSLNFGQDSRGPHIQAIASPVPSSKTKRVHCPYGRAGDRLWVRETWSADFANHYPHDRAWYAADDDRRHDIEVRDGVRGIYSPESGVHVPFRWRPSIHMPRAACRLVLEITGVRVERLNDCSEEDAIAEGIDPHPTGLWLPCREQGKAHINPKLAYRDLWDSINGAGAWETNPWVWVVEFRRIAP